MTLRRLGASAAACLLVACAADRPPPTPLQAYVPKIGAARVWEARMGRIGPAFVPAVKDGIFYLASAEGEVRAMQGETGEVLWRAQIGAGLSAAVGSDGRHAAVVTRDNEVVALDNGREVWRKRVPSSVVTPPLVAGERVFVLGVDRAVHAFDAIDGRRLWTLQRPGDPLTLSQAGVLAAFRNTLLVGQGPRLAGVDPLQGTLLWDAAMASPRGSNEVERLADLVGPSVRHGDRVCVRAFQSTVACADASRPAVMWSRKVGGTNAVAGDAERIFGADASDRITAWRAATGDVVWSSEKLLYRGLSGAAAVGPLVVFGDSEGWVHFLSASTGELQLRLPTSGEPVVGTPVVANGTLLVTTQDGGLYAFRPQ